MMTMARAVATGPTQLVGDDEGYQSQMNAIGEKLEKCKQAKNKEMDQLALLKKKKQEKKHGKKKLKQSTSAPSLSSVMEDRDQNQNQEKKLRNKNNSGNAPSLGARVPGVINSKNSDKEGLFSQGGAEERRKARKLARRRRDRSPTKTRIAKEASASSLSPVRKIKSDSDLVKKALIGSVSSLVGVEGTSEGKDGTRSNEQETKRAQLKDETNGGTRNGKAWSNDSSARSERSTTLLHEENDISPPFLASTDGTQYPPEKDDEIAIRASTGTAHEHKEAIKAVAHFCPQRGCFLTRTENTEIEEEEDLLRQGRGSSANASVGAAISRVVLSQYRSSSEGNLMRRLDDSARSGKLHQNMDTSCSSGRSWSSSRARRTKDNKCSRRRDNSCSLARSRSSSARAKRSTTDEALRHPMHHRQKSNSEEYLGSRCSSHNPKAASRGRSKRGRARRNISRSRSTSRSSSRRGQKSTIPEALPGLMLGHHRSCSEGDLLNLLNRCEHVPSADDSNTCEISSMKCGLKMKGVGKNVDDTSDSDQEPPSRPSRARGEGNHNINKGYISMDSSLQARVVVPFVESIPIKFQRKQRAASIDACESSCKTSYNESFDDLCGNEYLNEPDQPASLLGPSKIDAMVTETSRCNRNVLKYRTTK